MSLVFWTFISTPTILFIFESLSPSLSLSLHSPQKFKSIDHDGHPHLWLYNSQNMCCKSSTAANPSLTHRSTICGSMKVRFYNLIVDLQHKYNNWWLTFAVFCRWRHSAGCQAFHSLAPPKLTHRTRSIHRRRDGSVVLGWEVPGIISFLVMFCSHLQNFVFSRSCRTASVMGTESATIRHWWLGAIVHRIIESIAKFQGENQLLSPLSFVLS